MKPIWFDTSINQFKNAPDIKSVGLHSATMMSSWGFFRKLGGEYDYSHIDMETVKRVANDPKFWIGKESNMLVLDFEMLDLHTPDLPLRDHYHDQLIETVQIYREAHPGIAIGYYGELPQIAFYPPLYKTGDPAWAHYKPHYEEWVSNNKHVLTNLDDATLETTRKGLCAAVDRVFPSCYSGRKEPLPMPESLKWWKASHDGNVEESLQYQKPIIPYLTPQYQGRGEYFPAGVWKEMLQHSLNNKNTDGVCIYQSVVAGTEFDPSALWWTETLEAIGYKK
jgi:hypothetical protein